MILLPWCPLFSEPHQRFTVYAGCSLPFSRLPGQRRCLTLLCLLESQVIRYQIQCSRRRLSLKVCSQLSFLRPSPSTEMPSLCLSLTLCRVNLFWAEAMPQSQVYFVISNARPGTEQELNKLTDSPVRQMKMKRPLWGYREKKWVAE